MTNGPSWLWLQEQAQRMQAQKLLRDVDAWRVAALVLAGTAAVLVAVGPVYGSQCGDHLRAGETGSGLGFCQPASRNELIRYPEASPKVSGSIEWTCEPPRV